VWMLDGLCQMNGSGGRSAVRWALEVQCAHHLCEARPPLAYAVATMRENGSAAGLEYVLMDDEAGMIG
jgi:hypothetical protein